MALPDYLQDTAKDFAKQLTATTSVPIDTSTFTGRQFVGGEDPLQTQSVLRYRGSLPLSSHVGQSLK